MLQKQKKKNSKYADSINANEIYQKNYNGNQAQSVGAVEYTDCVSAEE